VAGNDPADALADALAKDLEEITRKIDKEVEAQLEKLMTKLGGWLDAPAKTEHARNAIAAIERAYDEAFGPDSEFALRVQKGMVKAGKQAQERLAAEAVKYGMKGVELARVDAASLIEAATETYDLAAKNLTSEAVGQLRDAVTQEYLHGGSVEALRSRLIKADFIPDLKVGKRTLRSEVRAAMMARTETKRIAVKTYMDTAARVEKNPAKRTYRWVSTLGKNVGEDSLIRHGRILTEQEWMTTDFGDGMYGLPPIRPNDRCSVIFKRDAWLSDTEREAKAGGKNLLTSDLKLWEKRKKALKGKKTPTPKKPAPKPKVPKPKKVKAPTPAAAPAPAPPPPAVPKVPTKVPTGIGPGEIFRSANPRVTSGTLDLKKFNSERWWENTLNKYSRKAFYGSVSDGLIGMVRGNDSLNKAMGFWTGGSYKAIRNAQRGRTQSKTHMAIANRCEKVVASLPKYEGTAYRGMGTWAVNVLDRFKVGGVYAEKALASWSQSPLVARNFTPGQEGIILRAQFKGKQGAPIHQLSADHAPEIEVLASSRAQFRVTKITEGGVRDVGGQLMKKFYVIDLEEI